MMRKKIDIEALNPLSGTINYRLELTYMAKKNRHTPTNAENIIWQNILRYKQTGDKFLYQIGIETIRFTNDEVINNLSLVKEKIKTTCSYLALTRGGGSTKLNQRG